MFGILYLSLLPRCLSWKEYVGQLALAALVFTVASLIFIKGREGKIEWRRVENPENSKRLSIGIAIYLGFLAVLTFLSTLFGWGC